MAPRSPREEKPKLKTFSDSSVRAKTKTFSDPEVRQEESSKIPTLCDHAPAPATHNANPSVQKVFWGEEKGKSRVLAETAE